MQFREVKFEGVSYIAPSWEEMGEVIFELSREILESGKKYNRVIALAKGGWTWARTLVDYLGMDELDSVRIKLYEGINKISEPKITHPVSKDIRGEKILIFDDVVDKGITMELACKHILEAGADSVETATLFFKPHSKFKPDFIGSETSAWIVFPHEFREFIDETYKKWRELGVSVAEIKQRYAKLDLPKEQVEYFIKKSYNLG